MKLITGFLFLLLAYPGIFAQEIQVHSFYSGYALLRDCGAYVLARKQQASEDEIDAATICAGYVMGVADTHDELMMANQKPLWCSPLNVTVGQMVNPIHRYIIENPERIHLSAFRIIQLALQEAYPCRTIE
jgi:hypothetical protein